MTTRARKGVPKTGGSYRRRSRARDFWDHLSYGAKTVTAIGAAVSILVAGYLAHTSQFANAGDFDKYREATKQDFGRLSGKVDSFAAQSDLNFIEIRKSFIADKVYDLRARPKLSPAEKASLMRYEADLENLSRQARDRQRAMDAMRTR